MKGFLAVSAIFLLSGLGFADDIAVPVAASEKSNMRRQNFNFSNMEIRSAFKALAATGRVDIVVAPNVGGQNVNLQLTDKSWQEAMIIMCQMFNLKYLVEDNYLYVQNMSDYNKMSLENASAAQQNGALAPLTREILKLKNTKAIDLEPAVKGLLSARGKLSVVERNNALLIFDTESNIEEIRQAVNDLDIETYQVNIQAQLITVDADALEELGVDWQFGSGSVGTLKAKPGQAGNGVGNVLSSNFSGSSGIGSGSSSGEAAAGGSVGGVAGATSQMLFGLFNGNLSFAVADLLKTAQGEVLAKPQITTLDNKQARIFMGEQVPIRVLDATGHQAVQLQDAGTSLTVTPHVTADGRILLDLNPEKNSFRVDASAGTILQKQSANTTVVVNDGETVVIAGLTTKEETESESGVPLLKDIPILGYFFKHKAKESRKRDLIIFVTPHIVQSTNKAGVVSKVNLPGRYENLSSHNRTGAFGSSNEAEIKTIPASKASEEPASESSASPK